MSWNLTKKVRLICGSRRDQEEGDELESLEESETHFAGPGEFKRREVSWNLTKKVRLILRVQARSRGWR